MVYYKKITAVYEKFCVKEPGPGCEYLNLKMFNSPETIFETFSYLTNETKEHFMTLHLDAKLRILCMDTVSIGSLSSSQVHPREVFKTALLSSAHSLVLMHNHPSGGCNPSAEDINITRKLIAGGKLLGIKIIDHIIIGEGFYSFRDHGFNMEG